MIKGVKLQRGMKGPYYTAGITINGKRKHLYSGRSLEKATECRLIAEVEKYLQEKQR
jgi:hypothetical protein